MLVLHKSQVFVAFGGKKRINIFIFNEQHDQTSIGTLEDSNRNHSTVSGFCRNGEHRQCNVEQKWIQIILKNDHKRRVCELRQ